MKYYIVTGASSGIGLSLVEQLVEMPNTKVFGISRSTHISHANYTAITLDLSDPSAVGQFEFPVVENATQIVLINNAGQVGDIKPVGRVSAQAVVNLYNVNVTAPALLTNHFISAYQAFSGYKAILNVSSGAGKKAIDGWATYCSSKAALDLFSQTVFEEQKTAQNPVRIFSVAPGVVDTKMQSEIRASNTTNFSRHAHFVGLKEKNELTSADTVAEKYIMIVNSPDKFEQCIFSLRDLA